MASKKAVYEGMFIFDSNRLARDRDSLPRDVEKLIEQSGGKIEVSRLWEERRLAYPIKGQRKGSYWITYFHLPTSALTELTRQLELKDGVLRHLFIRLPDALVEPILEHAKGERVEDSPTSAEDNGEKPKEESAVGDAVEATAS